MEQSILMPHRPRARGARIHARRAAREPGDRRILVFAGVPAYQHWLGQYQLNNQAQFMAGAFNEARSEAIRRNLRVTLCKTRDGRTCDEDARWEQGWIMFVDQNQNGDLDDDEPVLRTEGPAQARVSVHGNQPVADYVSFTSLGHARMLSGALQMGTLQLCLSGYDAVKVVLANGGRARIERTQERCA
jgi:type IV fimbrial biogenesis protein FimT